MLHSCQRSCAGLWSQIKRAPKAKKRRKTYEVDGPARPGAVPLDNRARQIFEYFKKYNYEVKDTGEVITFAGTYQASKAQAAALVFYTFCGELQLDQHQQLGEHTPLCSIACGTCCQYCWLVCLASCSKLEKAADACDGFLGASALMDQSCSALPTGLASTALVLSIAVPFGHEKWYLLVALSPLAGGYYFQRGTRQENFLVITLLRHLGTWRYCQGLVSVAPTSYCHCTVAAVRERAGSPAL